MKISKYYTRMFPENLFWQKTELPTAGEEKKKKVQEMLSKEKAGMTLREAEKLKDEQVLKTLLHFSYC